MGEYESVMRVYHLLGKRRNSGLVSIRESQHQDHCMWEKNKLTFLIIYPC